MAKFGYLLMDDLPLWLFPPPPPPQTSLPPESLGRDLGNVAEYFMETTKILYIFLGNGPL